MIMNHRVVETKQGTFALGPMNDFIAGSLINKGEYELELMEKAMKLLNIDGTLLDVGAHIGTTSIGLIYTDLMDRAVAIEPEGKNFALLEQNVKLNGFENKFICLHTAISNHNGSALLELNPRNTGDNRVRVMRNGQEAIKIACTTLDDVVEKLPSKFADISLLWVDVQGHEWYVFEGAKDLLASGIPVVSEIWPYGILQSGISLDKFCASIAALWSHYWKLKEDKFVKYSTDDFDWVYNAGKRYANVIFA